MAYIALHGRAANCASMFLAWFSTETKLIWLHCTCTHVCLTVVSSTKTCWLTSLWFDRGYRCWRQSSAYMLLMSMWQAGGKTAHSIPKSRKSCKGDILLDIREPARVGTCSTNLLSLAAARHKPTRRLSSVLGVLMHQLVCPRTPPLTNPLTNCSHRGFLSSGLIKRGSYNLQALLF